MVPSEEFFGSAGHRVNSGSSHLITAKTELNFKNERTQLLPTYLKKDALVRKCVNICDACINGNGSNSTRITIGDVKRFTRTCSRELGPGAKKQPEGTRFEQLAKVYLSAYYDREREFVTRTEEKISRPKLSTQIGNDVILSLIHI